MRTRFGFESIAELAAFVDLVAPIFGLWKLSPEIVAILKEGKGLCADLSPAQMKCAYYYLEKVFEAAGSGTLLAASITEVCEELQSAYVDMTGELI